jgi:glycosyltransferase involved in cell wall biosynthesis
MMFRAGALKDALTLAELYPDRIITYNLDRIVDHTKPIRVEQYAVTEKVLSVETIDLSRLLSQAVFHPSLPRMFNCVVPVQVFGRMERRFGDIFSSIAPDFRFCCRCLELEETVVYYDKSLLLHYALDRSHGATLSRGEINADVADFTANLSIDNSIRNFATPIPALNTAVNAIFHEYCLFKQETNSTRFFYVDLRRYLQANADEIQEFTDPVRRAETLALMTDRGYAPAARTGNAMRAPLPFSKRLKSKLKRGATSPSTTGPWLFLTRATGIKPPGENSFTFPDLERAIDYAKNVSGGNFRRQHSHHMLRTARELPVPTNALKRNHAPAPVSLRHALGSVIPRSVKQTIHGKLNDGKLARLRRTKERFRSRRAAGRAQDLGHGVNLVAYIRADMGLGSAARSMAAALDTAGVPFNVINMEHGYDSSRTDRSWSHKEVQRSDYDVTVVCVNPDNSFYLRTQIPTDVLGDRYVIANWYWELPDMPDEWLAEFQYVDEVWAASRFITDAISQKAPVPVVRIPPVVQLSRGYRYSRAELGLPENRFLFLAMFDTRSVLERKNPLGVLRAFTRAFRSDDQGVGLVMKFSNPDHDQPMLREIQEELAGWNNVLVIDRLLNREELTSLIDACDCLVSLHRAEGFGLVPAEAMSLGKAAIVTNWSGNTDYMTGDNCIGIGYELVALGRPYGPYKADQHWAEPDLEEAAYWMRRLVAEPELARTIGLRGQQTINSQFSPEIIGNMIQGRLHQIRTT